MFTKYTDTDDYLLFVYKRSDIFDDVRHLSAFMAKNVTTKEGQPLLEQLSISEDDAPMFGLCLRDSLPDVWELFSKLTVGVSNPYNEAEIFQPAEPGDTTVTIGTLTLTVGTEYVTLRIVDNGAYNVNLLPLVDASIRSVVELGALRKWYTRISQQDLLKMADESYASEVAALIRRATQLLRKTVYMN